MYGATGTPRTTAPRPAVVATRIEQGSCRQGLPMVVLIAKGIILKVGNAIQIAAQVKITSNTNYNILNSELTFLIGELNWQ